MDILARIEEVIKQRGTNKAEVSEKMGKAKQNFKSLLTNPKWDSLELVCKAIGIEPWQLFEQEIMAAGYRIAPQPAAESASAEQQQAVSGEGGASDLPFGCGEPSAIGQQAIVCPHCHQALVVNIASYEQK